MNVDRACSTQCAAERQVANEMGRAIFGGSTRKGSGGIAGALVRGVLGSLFK